MQNKTMHKDDELNNILNEFRVPYPDEWQINQTIDCLRQYVPCKHRNSHYENLKRLLKDTALSLSYMQISYWVITILIYMAGYIVAVTSFANSYKVLFVIAPLPIIFGLIDVFRGREDNVVELELSCKITPQEIVISKILITCIYNTILNSCFSLIIYFQSPLLLIGKITLLWLVPMTLTGGIALWFCSRIKNVYSILGSVSCWIAASVFIASQEQYFASLLKINAWIYLPLSCIGIGLYIKEFVKLKNRYYFERGTSYGIDD